MPDAVDYFNSARDAHYKIPTTLTEEDNCCSGKHKKLHQLLQSINVKVRYRVCEFLWEDVNLPKEVEKIPHDDACTHTYLEVYNPHKEKWVVVDATWDRGLSNVFKINEWDGENDTAIAVKPTKIYSPEESKRFVENESVDDMKKDLGRNGKFYRAVNTWLETVRIEVTK